MSENLTSSQAEKLSSLAEGVVYENSKQFAHSVELLRESYFPDNVKSGKGEVLVEGGLDKPVAAENETEVDAYSKYIDQTMKN